MIQGIRLDGRVGHSQAVRIFINQIDVVLHFAAIFVTIDATRATYRLGYPSQEPIHDLQLMASQLRHQTLRILVVESPVFQVLQVRVAPRAWIKVNIGNPSTPVSVTMPQGSYMVNVTNDPAIDQPLGLAIKGTIAALVTDLQIPPCRLGRLDHAAAALNAVCHRLLAKHMLAGLEGVHSHRVMQPQGRSNQNGLDIPALQQLSVICVRFRTRVVHFACYLQTFFQVLGEDVTNCHQTDVAGRAIFHENPALPAGSDDAGAHRRHSTCLPNQCSCCRHGSHRLDEIPSP